MNSDDDCSDLLGRRGLPEAVLTTRCDNQRSQSGEGGHDRVKRENRHGPKIVQPEPEAGGAARRRELRAEAAQFLHTLRGLEPSPRVQYNNQTSRGWAGDNFPSASRGEFDVREWASTRQKHNDIVIKSQGSLSAPHRGRELPPQPLVLLLQAPYRLPAIPELVRHGAVLPLQSPYRLPALPALVRHGSPPERPADEAHPVRVPARLGPRRHHRVYRAEAGHVEGAPLRGWLAGVEPVRDVGQDPRDEAQGYPPLLAEVVGPAAVVDEGLPPVGPVSLRHEGLLGHHLVEEHPVLLAERADVQRRVGA
ncbi:hypothetical protein THAOC_29741, partial [Thalassiosira oceanica]